MEFKYKCNLLVAEVQGLCNLHGERRVGKQSREAALGAADASISPSLSETGADQAINIVKNTKAPSDLNPPKESDPNQIRKID